MFTVSPQRVPLRPSQADLYSYIDATAVNGSSTYSTRQQPHRSPASRAHRRICYTPATSTSAGAIVVAISKNGDVSPSEHLNISIICSPAASGRVNKNLVPIHWTSRRRPGWWCLTAAKDRNSTDSVTPSHLRIPRYKNPLSGTAVPLGSSQAWRTPSPAGTETAALLPRSTRCGRAGGRGSMAGARGPRPAEVATAPQRPPLPAPAGAQRQTATFAMQRRFSSPGTGPRRRRRLLGAARPVLVEPSAPGHRGGWPARCREGRHTARSAPPGPAFGPASAPWRAARSLWRLQCWDGAGPPAGRDNGCAQLRGTLRDLRRRPEPSPKRLTPSRPPPPPPSLRQSRPEPGRAHPRRHPPLSPFLSRGGAEPLSSRAPPAPLFRSGDWVSAETPPGRLAASVIN